MSLIFASITLAFCLLFFTGFLKNLPKAVLATIVLVAITGLINFREIGRLWRVSRLEFTVAAVALVGVLLLGMGVGMHAGYLPGYLVSHRCIRLPKEMAVRFFQNVPIGTPVAIRQEVPWGYGPNPLIPERFAPLTSITER